MPARKSRSTRRTVLLVESDVLVRFALADHLRACGLTVIEAASADDAKAILVAGPAADLLLSDAQLAGEGGGFMLAQWVRRHRPAIEIVLTASIASKVQAAADLASSIPGCASDAATLAVKLNAMLAQRKRRLRRQPRSVAVRTRRRKRV